MRLSTWALAAPAAAAATKMAEKRMVRCLVGLGVGLEVVLVWSDG
jgi:hypothetical protein